MNVVGFREDSTLFTSLLKFYQNKENKLQELRLATGYLNLTKDYTSLINGLPAKTHILTASPKANGFYKSGFIKKYIPGLYRMKAIEMLSKSKNVEIHEYTNGDWTYHAKGAWFYEEDEANGPVMSVIGSSNLSNRSIKLDTELQLYLVSECESFKQRLHQEQKHLFDKAPSQSIQDLLDKEGCQYKITWREKVMSKMLKYIL